MRKHTRCSGCPGAARASPGVPGAEAGAAGGFGRSALPLRVRGCSAEGALGPPEAPAGPGGAGGVPGPLLCPVHAENVPRQPQSSLQKMRLLLL